MGPEVMVVFRNTGNAPTGSISTAMLTGAEFAITQDNCVGGMLGPTNTCNVKVRMNPTSAGMKTGTLQLSASPGGMPVAMLSGAGTDGLVSMPSLHDFMGISVGQMSAPVPITFRNDGTGPSGTISAAVAFMGPDAAHFMITGDSCYMQNLAMGATCTVNVLFKPTAAGMRGASVTLNSPTLGSVSADLEGVGL